MSKSDLLKELRALTQAGMKDCSDALKEAGDDLQKAVDIIKTKGQNIVSARSSAPATEGLVAISTNGNSVCLVEVNCQTDFVARNPSFVELAQFAADTFIKNTGDAAHDVTNIDPWIKKKESLIAQFKENIVMGKWWIEESLSPICKVFSYIHNGSKLGVLLTLQAPSEQAANSEAFRSIGMDLAMQIAAMNPVAVSADKIPVDVLDRQKNIFLTQVKELNKPAVQETKILEGKMNKWFTEACLLKQGVVYSDLLAKRSVESVIKSEYAVQLGGELTVVNFIRHQVGAQ